MTTESLASAIRVHYGYDIVRLEEVGGGKDAYALTFCGFAQDGESYFIKLKQSIDAGIRLSGTLRDRGIEGVLAPVKTLDGYIWADTGSGFLLLYPFVKGWNGFSGPISHDHWKCIGRILRQVHDANLTLTELDGIAVESFAVPEVAEFEVTRNRVVGGDTNSDAEESLGDLLRENEERVEEVLNQYLFLGHQLLAASHTFVPCHADLHWGNVLATESGEVFVIDWDSPRFAPRECDMIFFCDGGILKRHGEAEEGAFLSGYGSVEIDPILMTYYRYARDLEDYVAYTREVTDLSFSAEQNREAVEWLARLF